MITYADSMGARPGPAFAAHVCGGGVWKRRSRASGEAGPCSVRGLQRADKTMFGGLNNSAGGCNGRSYALRALARAQLGLAS